MIQTLFGSTEEKKTGLFERMKRRSRARGRTLPSALKKSFLSARKSTAVRSTIWKPTLIGADLGCTTTQEVLGKLRDKADRKQIKDVQELKRLLKEELLAILKCGECEACSTSIRNARSNSGGRGQRNRQDDNHWPSCRRYFARRGKSVLLCAPILSARLPLINSKSGDSARARK